MQSLPIISPKLAQENYLSDSFSLDRTRAQRIKAVAKRFGKMSASCKISICIPAYRESSLLRNTLLNYTIYQTDLEGVPLNPELFEVNILINRPNEFSERDTLMLDVIREFKTEFPAYHINIAEIIYDFHEKAVMGLIFKDIADAVILRNMKRNISTRDKSRLILRTAGADVEALNPLLLSRTLTLFTDQSIIAHR